MVVCPQGTNTLDNTVTLCTHHMTFLGLSVFTYKQGICFVCLCDAGDQAQGFVHAEHTLHPTAALPTQKEGLGSSVSALSCHPNTGICVGEGGKEDPTCRGC